MDDQNNQNQGQMGQDNQTPPSAPKNNMLMGILCYLGLLIIIPYLMRRNDPFVKFHIQQGLVVFAINVVVLVFRWVTGPLGILLNLINLATFILAIIGIVNVVKAKEKELPLVGKFAHNFHI